VLVRRSAVALVAVLMLAGCSGDDPDPVADPTATASSPAPAGEPTVSATPESSEQRESAEAFIRRWFELYRDLQETGQSESFVAVSRTCDACAATVDRFRTIYAAGGEIRGGRIAVTRLQRVGETKNSETWVAHVSTTPTRYRESASAAWQRLDGGDGAFRLVLREHATSYVVGELFQESV
jgi:hypothetical protein